MDEHHEILVKLTDIDWKFQSQYIDGGDLLHVPSEPFMVTIALVNNEVPF